MTSMGKEPKKRVEIYIYIYMYMADSLCYTAETNTTL